MENKANYFYIGIFVFGVFFISLFFMIWLSGFSHKEKFEYYQIFTKESISGLGVKTPVRLLGVDIGTVEETSIDTTQGVEVRILIKVKQGTPITEKTYASLALQGITGLKYVELYTEDGETKLLESKSGEIPTIKVKESLLSAIDKQGDKFLELVRFTDERLRLLFSDNNVKNFSSLLQNFANLSKDLDKNLNPAVTNFNLVSQKMTIMADSLNTDLELLEQLLLQINELIVNLQKSPSDIFFKSSKNKPAPGE